MTSNRVQTITAKVETITPSMARKMLGGNVVNRNLRRGRVNLYAKYMAAGQWRVTGESIVFDPEGRLLQGQHRLTACVEADVSFRSVVVRGVEAAAMKVMDTGMSRTAADAFKLEGVDNYTGQAAMVKRLIAISLGVQRDTGAQALITRDELLQFHDDHAESLRAAWDLSRPTASAIKISHAGWGALAFILLEADADLAFEFFDGLASGAGLKPGDPRLAYRNYLINKILQRSAPHWTEQVATGIRVWNSWIDGKSIDHVKGWRSRHAWPTVSS